MRIIHNQKQISAQYIATVNNTSLYVDLRIVLLDGILSIIK